MREGGRGGGEGGGGGGSIGLYKEEKITMKVINMKVIFKYEHIMTR